MLFPTGPRSGLATRVRRRALASPENSVRRAGRNSRPRQCRRSTSRLAQARGSVHSSVARSSPTRSGAAAQRHSALRRAPLRLIPVPLIHSVNLPYSGARVVSRACEESYSSGVPKMEWAPLCWRAGPAPRMTRRKYLGILPKFASRSVYSPHQTRDASSGRIREPRGATAACTGGP